MDICFTSHRYAPLVGGYENQLRLLAENLSESFNVKVVTFQLRANKNFESLSGVEVYRVKPQLTIFRVPFSVDFLKVLGKVDFDILQANGFVPVVSDLSIFQAKLKNKLAIYSHHFDGNVQDSGLLNLAANFYNETVGRSSVRLADSIVATSKSYAESSPMIKGSMDKVHVIPCFVDCSVFEPQPASKVLEFKRQLGFGEEKIVLFVGRIVPYKGLEYLLKAFERINASGEKFKLLIVGGGEGKKITDTSQYSQTIHNIAAKSSAQENIRFLGRIEGHQLPMYYSMADVVVLPSVMRGEAFGSTLLEGLACGTPVVASGLPGVRDVLKNNHVVGCYVPPRDEAALSDAIVKMAHKKEAISDKCREFAYDNYRKERIVKEYADLYSSLCN